MGVRRLSGKGSGPSPTVTPDFEVYGIHTRITEGLGIRDRPTQSVRWEAPEARSKSPIYCRFLDP